MWFCCFSGKATARACGFGKNMWKSEDRAPGRAAARGDQTRGGAVSHSGLGQHELAQGAWAGLGTSQLRDLRQVTLPSPGEHSRERSGRARPGVSRTPVPRSRRPLQRTARPEPQAAFREGPGCSSGAFAAPSSLSHRFELWAHGPRAATCRGSGTGFPHRDRGPV